MWRSDARWRRLTPLGCVAFTKVKWFTCALGNTSSTPSWNAEQPEKKREKPVKHKKVFTNVLSHACASSRECWGRTSAGWKELLTDEYFPADCLNSMRLPQWRDTWGRASIRRAEWVHFYQCTGLIDIHFRWSWRLKNLNNHFMFVNFFLVSYLKCHWTLIQHNWK